MELSRCAHYRGAIVGTPEETAAHVDDTLEVIQQHYTVPTPQERRETATTKPII